MLRLVRRVDRRRVDDDLAGGRGPPGNAADQQIVSGNWFYRVVNADTRERHLADASTRTTTGSNYVYYRFDQIWQGGASPVVNTDLWAEMDWKVTDTGPNSALCETQVCFHNYSGTPVDIDVFLAIDFHLNNTAANDDYDALAGGNLWRLTDGLWTGLMYGPGAVGAGVGNSTGVNGIMSQMTNTTASDFTIPQNPGGGIFPDGAALLQFRQTVAGQSMFCPSARLAIGIGVEPPLFIPEPTSLALVGLGAAIVLLRRRSSLLHV
jgi:hypothetical protein